MSTRRCAATWPRAAAVLLLIAALLEVSALMAQPARGRIISNVTVSEQADRTVLAVEFTFPVRYVRHFPEDYGETVEIQLKEVMVSAIDADLLQRRESYPLQDIDNVPLLDISYEGDLPGGPYLTVRFYKPVAFTVRQGSDFRSLAVTVFNNNAGNN